MLFIDLQNDMGYRRYVGPKLLCYATPLRRALLNKERGCPKILPKIGILRQPLFMK